MDVKELLKGLEKKTENTMDDKLIEILLRMMDRKEGIDLNTLLGFMLIRDMMDKSRADNVYLSLLQNEIKTLKEEISKKESKPSDDILKMLIMQYLQGNISSRDLIQTITSMSQNMVQTYRDVYEKLYEKSSERSSELVQAISERLSEVKEAIRDLERKYEELSKKRGSLEEISDALNKINQIYQASKEIDNIIKQYRLEKEPLVKEGQLNIEKLLDLGGKFLSLLLQHRPEMKEVKPPEIKEIPKEIPKEIQIPEVKQPEVKQEIEKEAPVFIEKPEKVEIKQESGNEILEKLKGKK